MLGHVAYGSHPELPQMVIHVKVGVTRVLDLRHLLNIACGVNRSCNLQNTFPFSGFIVGGIREISKEESSKHC